MRLGKKPASARASGPGRDAAGKRRLPVRPMGEWRLPVIVTRIRVATASRAARGERTTRSALPPVHGRATMPSRRPGAPDAKRGNALSAIEHHPSRGEDDRIGAMMAGIRLGNWKAAREQAVGVIGQERPDVRSLALAGRILETCGAWRDAADLYRRFAACAPALLYPQVRLCHVLARAGRPRGALQDVLSTLDGLAPSSVRIAALRAMLAEPDIEAVPAALRWSPWRRWFRGAAEWHEGEAVSRSGIAVVVIGFRAQPGLSDAVESLLDQDAEAEIVVVNSGGGDVHGLLARRSARLRIITIAQPLYAGAARNVGIDTSVAPCVAFLAGDCVARPGWTRTRLEMHRRGSRAVASAMVAADAGGDLALAAHLALFGARSPQVPPNRALRYGASYERQVFREFGYFDPSLRISEDTDFARRTAKSIHPAWNPRVQTQHGSPSGPVRFVLDMYGRGKRAARHWPSGGDRSPWRWSTLRDVLAATRQRNRIAQDIARAILEIEPRRLAGVRRHLLPGTFAYGIGIVMGLRNLRRARRHRERSAAHGGAPSSAGAHREAALRGDPDDLRLLLAAAERCLSRGAAPPDAGGHLDDAGVHLDAAARVAGFHEDRMLALADWLIRHGRHERAWMLGDRATVDLPHAVRIHRQLALAAHQAGDAAAFELAALDALARDPDADGLWPLFQSFLSRPTGDG